VKRGGPLRRKAPLKAKGERQTPRRKPKGPTLSQAKRRAWTAFSRFVRLRDALETTGTTQAALCCTCGKEYPAFGKGCLQAGHFLPGRRWPNLLDERGCHAQCYVCNCRLKGNPAEYWLFMERHYGRDVIDDLIERDRAGGQVKAHEMVALAELYEAKAAKLEAPTG
jgi:hypothetical protein